MPSKFALVIITLAALQLGCATTGELSEPASATDDLQLSTPRDPQFVRRAAGVGQAGVLYGRTVYVDPVLRPVSSFLTYSSLILKSARGFARRTFLRTVQVPALADEPVPDAHLREGMNLARWEKHLDRITGSRSSRGKIRFLVDGEEYFRRLGEAIANAQDSVDMRTYIFDNDDFAVAFGDELKQRSFDVRIRVMVDGIGNLLAHQVDPESLPADHVAPLSMTEYLERGSRIDARTLTNPWLTGDHTKTTIIDGRIAFVGGMNIGREYRYDWHDLMLEVEGPVVDQLQHDHDKAWARAGMLGDLGNFLQFVLGRSRRAGDLGYPLRVLYTRNFDSQIYRAQLAAIRRAQSRIIIENPYFADDAILYELARARRRGVDVRVILPASGNHGLTNASNRVSINHMLEAGIRVFVYPGMTHVKAAVFDGWACVGSANYDKLSLEINKELNIATSHPEAVAELLRRVLLPDMAKSVELSQSSAVTMATRLMEITVDEFL